MNIVVFIKQVPDTTDVKWTENNNIDRTKMESIMNPVDRQAIECALFFKDNYNAQITAVSMGPKGAIKILEEAIALGVDNAILLFDSKFAGSDTCATSRVLSSLIKEKLPNTDLILFGQSAIDGETSQTGPSVATRLNLPFITQVNEIKTLENNLLTLTSDTEYQTIEYKVELPCVLCINNYVTPARLPKISGYINSQNYEYKIYSLIDLKLSPDEVGIKGSPTWVSKVFKSKEGRKCNFLNTQDNSECINAIKTLVQEATINE